MEYFLYFTQLTTTKKIIRSQPEIVADVPAIERLIEYDSFDIALTGWYSTTKHHAKVKF